MCLVSNLNTFKVPIATALLIKPKIEKLLSTDHRGPQRKKRATEIILSVDLINLCGPL